RPQTAQEISSNKAEHQRDKGDYSGHSHLFPPHAQVSLLPHYSRRQLYPFVLGAQPVRPIDLAAFYATIANEGLHPAPHVIDSIERNGVVIYRHDPKLSVIMSSVDRAAFYQLKTMLQGVLARGTARSIAGLAPYVAGKTGTSDEENDAWFVGF